MAGTYTGNYELSTEEYRMAYYYAMQYETWKKRCADAGEKEKGRLIEKIGIIERTAMEADADIYKYLLEAVTTRGVGYEMLHGRGMPCGRNRYYNSRRRFYYLLLKQI